MGIKIPIVMSEKCSRKISLYWHEQLKQLKIAVSMICNFSIRTIKCPIYISKYENVWGKYIYIVTTNKNLHKLYFVTINSNFIIFYSQLSLVLM